MKLAKRFKLRPLGEGCREIENNPHDGEGSVPGKKLLQSKIEVVNIGLPLFAEALVDRNIPVVQVDWTPPAGGDERLIELLDRLSE